jgi:imidazolonepropionase-like amidohydrolase
MKIARHLRAPTSAPRTTALAAPLAAALAAALSACAPSSAPPDLAIENVTVIDAVHGLREARTVVVDEGRIVRVEAAGTPTGARQVLDGTGRYLIPGLWDFHVHLTYDDRFTEAMPELFLRYGVTSIRDTGGILEKLLPVVTALENEAGARPREVAGSDGRPAPRVFFAGPLLDGEVVVYDGEHRPALGIATPDPETAREHVAMLAEAGADFIKIYEMVSPEVFHALADAAEELGLPVDAHVPLSMLARDVGPRVSSLEHLRNLELDCAAGAETLLAERRRLLAAHDGGSGAELRGELHGRQRLAAVADYDPERCDALLAALAATTQVPTLRLNALGLHPPFGQPGWEAALERIPAAAADEWRAVAEARRSGGGASPARDTTFAVWSLFLVGAMHEAGVPIAAGTDTPIGYAIPGYSLHRELELLVRAGLSPLEALGSATLGPAELFGLADDMGVVEEGRLADLVLLTANPLDDIANTQAIEAVVAGGRVVVPPR